LSSRRLYPKFPIAGVGTLIKKEGRYLLIKRAADPDAGLWSIPGGLIEVGEKAVEAAIREAYEETGLEIRIISILDVMDKIVIGKDDQVKYHFVIIDYLAEPIAGELNPRDDALDAQWVYPKDFRSYNMSSTLVELLKELDLY
jgi:ADP-ribose pyrophosphatase